MREKEGVVVWEERERGETKRERGETKRDKGEGGNRQTGRNRD